MRISTLFVVFLLVLSASVAQAQNRLFVPDFHLGAGTDTQLLISNNDDHDATVDIWAFLKAGELLGQVQVRMNPHSTRSATLQELFGNSAVENTGWLGVVSNQDGVQLTYTVSGADEHAQARDAQPEPVHQLTVEAAANEKVLRISNASSTENAVTLRKIDSSGRFLGIQQVSVAPFAQLELLVSAGTKLELSGTSDFVAERDDVQRPEGGRRPPARSSDEVLAVIIDSETAIGAYQLRLQFDPRLAQIAVEDIQGGAGAGFESKPLAIAVDNSTGQIRLAAFQVGSEPAGKVHVATIHVRKLTASAVRFGMNVEEITDIKGDSILTTLPTVRLVHVR